MKNTIKTTAQMKAAIEKMLALYDECDRLMFTDEEASDRAYEAASALCAKLTDTIVSISRGLIDRPTARTMVLKMPERLLDICK